MKIVYYASSFVPPELITACGCVPQRFTAGYETHSVSQSEGMCPFTEIWLETLRQKCSHDNATAIFTTSCDQMRRAYDLYCGDLPENSTFLLNVPSVDTPNALNYYRQELQRLQDFLCALSGGPFDEKKMAPQTILPTRKNTAQNGKPLKLAIIGESISDLVHNTLDDLLNPTSAEIALDITDDTLMYHGVDSDMESIQPNAAADLAAGYFQTPAIWKRPNDTFLESLIKLVQAHHIDGVVVFRYVFCDVWHSAVYELKKRLPIPILEIDLDGSELSASSASRVQSFTEMLAQ